MENLLEATWECASCHEAYAEDDDRNETLDGDVCDTCHHNVYGMCAECQESVHHHDLRSVGAGDDTICDDCIHTFYTQCAGCEDYTSKESIYGVDSRSYCYSCYENMPYCDVCERIYHEDNSDDHDHGGGCGDDCQPLPLGFTIPVSEGSDTVGADQPFSVTLEGGLIPETARYLVQGLIREACSHDPEHPLYTAAAYAHSVGPEWKTAEGTYPKRLRRKVYKASRDDRIARLTGAYKERWYNPHRGIWDYQTGPWMDEASAKRMAKGYSLPDDLVARIGALCEPYTRPVNITVEATRDINGEPEDFCHEDSCWWGSEAHSRCTLKTNGGFALRTSEESSNVTWDGYAYTETKCTGRVWVLPLRKRDQFNPGPAFVPVTDAVLDRSTVDAWAVFNGYGTLSEMTAAHVVSSMTGLPHKHVHADRDDWNMWVNSGAYIVAEQSILDTLPNTLYLGLKAHN